MDFVGLAELKVSTFTPSKVVQCKERPREERRYYSLYIEHRSDLRVAF
jgi:hypothetical protein